MFLHLIKVILTIQIFWIMNEGNRCVPNRKRTMREFIALPNHVRPLRGRFVLLIIFSTDMRSFQGRSVNLLNRNTF